MDTTNIRQYVFAPPLYQTQILHGDPRGYVIIPKVAQIRQAVAQAFRVDPAAEAQREKVAAENARVWVLNGSGRTGQASDLANYLVYQGLDATAPNQLPKANRSTTSIVVYNGVETKLPQTVALLQRIFSVQVTLKTDATARVDIVITTGSSTPAYTPPPFAP